MVNQLTISWEIPVCLCHWLGWWGNSMLNPLRQTIKMCPRLKCSWCAQAMAPKTLPAGKPVPLPTLQWPWSQLVDNFISSSLNVWPTPLLWWLLTGSINPCAFCPWPVDKTVFTHVFLYFGIPEDTVSGRGSDLSWEPTGLSSSAGLSMFRTL